MSNPANRGVIVSSDGRVMSTMQRVAVRLGLMVITLSAIALIGGSARADSQDTSSNGPRFVFKCTQAGPAAPGGSLGPTTCTLTVRGLPDPLEDKVVLTFSSGSATNDAPNDYAPGETVVSYEAPAIAPRGPVLVSRSLPVIPPPPSPISPHVPEPPPKSL